MLTRLVLLCGLALLGCQTLRARSPNLFLQEEPGHVPAGQDLHVSGLWAARCANAANDLIQMSGGSSDSTPKSYWCDEQKVQLQVTCSAACTVQSRSSKVVTVTPEVPGPLTLDATLVNVETGQKESRSYPGFIVDAPDVVGLWCSSKGTAPGPCIQVRVDPASRVQVMSEWNGKSFPVTAFRVNDRALVATDTGVPLIDFLGEAPRAGRYTVTLEAAGLRVSRTIEVIP